MTKTISSPLLLAASLACNWASADLLGVTGTDPDRAALSLDSCVTPVPLPSPSATLPTPGC
jgi:hypothetical protein